MRAHPFVAKARHFGTRAYDVARHGLTGVNKIVENGAYFYGGIIQPLLRHAGVDTSGADTALHGAYTGYSHLRDAANKIDGMIN